jgi:S1-C subfamily serine protease
MLRPWEIIAPTKNTGSGVLLEGGRILTNAHVVAHAQEVYVQPYKSSDRLTAKVEWLALDCDMAILKIEDPKEMGDVKPLPLADSLPKLKSKITVMGYPTGGDTLSLTEGIVSRIELSGYSYGTAALRIQVDAAVNPGNSGGPGVIDGKVVGIVFSVLREAENIGYIIPAEVIRHFMEDWAKDGKYDGYPRLELECDTLENPALRAFLRLEKKDMGIVVRRHDRPDIAELIRPWDVISECDGVPIDNMGMVQIEDGMRVQVHALTSRKPAGASVRLKIIRDGQRLEVEVPTITRRDSVIGRMAGERPTYFIYGGLILTPVTQELVNSVNDRYITILALRGRKISQSLSKVRHSPDDEVVATCAQILPHRLTKGYDISPLSIVTHVNDKPVRNLRHLIEMLKESREKDFVVIRFDDDREERVVLNPKEAEKLGPEILRNNNIPSPFSEDLKGLWP